MAMLTRLIPLMLPVLAALWQPDPRTALADRVMRLGRDADWKLVETVPVGFTTHHPQGMVKVGDAFFVSSVEIKLRTRRFAQPVDGYDRDTGEGAGHLFKLDRSGKLLADLRLGEGTIYHPGGIDYDGKHIWVPVAEYRPNSRSIVYRVDPETMKATEVLRFADHIGAVVHNIDGSTLHGVSWGSRRFYRWPLGIDGRAGDGSQPVRTLNPSHYVDYQDCKYAGRHRMLCTGISEMGRPTASAPFRLGGLDLVDLRESRAVHQVPLLLWTPGGQNMAQNPAWLEPSVTDANGLRVYFMPEDDASSIYVYEVAAR
jgi:Family of unknown function (DUF6454)